MFIIKALDPIIKVDQIKIGKDQLESIIGGYIRFCENRKISRAKGQIVTIRNITRKIYDSEQKDNISKVDKFEIILNTLNDPKIIKYYKDSMDFLRNYSDPKEVLSMYKENIIKSETDSLYEFLLKIDDVFESKTKFLRSERELYTPHKILKNNNYNLLGKKLYNSNEYEYTLLYTEIEEIISHSETKLPKYFKDNKKLFWWDKEIISSQSKACRNNGYMVKEYDNEKVTFIKIKAEFKYKDKVSKEIIKEKKYYDGEPKSELANKNELIASQASEEILKENNMS
ncbi:MAG: hypothetical protein ACI8WT_003856 [Clostridium sp.]|jgi:hypothetical protein